VKRWRRRPMPSFTWLSVLPERHMLGDELRSTPKRKHR
jgi:hypothetical protein